MGLLDAAGGLLSGLGSAAQGWMNWQAQKDTNAANLQMNAANNEQNMELTTGQWARDDNAIQRRVADMRAAGLNPVLAAGQGAQSSAPISMQAGRVGAPQISGMGDSLSKGAGAYSALVQAKALKKQVELDLAGKETSNLILANQRHILAHNMVEAKAKADLAKHDADYYNNSPLPTNASNTEIGKLVQARAAFQSWAREHPGVVPGAILDLMGGTE